MEHTSLSSHSPLLRLDDSRTLVHWCTPRNTPHPTLVHRILDRTARRHRPRNASYSGAPPPHRRAQDHQAAHGVSFAIPLVRSLMLRLLRRAHASQLSLEPFGASLPS